jgi:hypothetical protein
VPLMSAALHFEPRFETVLLTTNVIVIRVCGRAFAIPIVYSHLCLIW